MVDVDHHLLTSARGEVHASENVSCLCGSATTLPIGDESHDFAIARFVFQHVPNRYAAARELRRVLVPGGRIAAIDSDDTCGTLFDPPIRELGIIGIKVALAQRLQGGDRTVGGKLPRILDSAGFTDVTLDTITLSSDELGLDAFRNIYDVDYLLPLVDSGLLTRDELDAAGDGLVRFFAATNAQIIETRFVATGMKPLVDA
jgi:SAM-dependent methyltransferase